MTEKRVKERLLTPQFAAVFVILFAANYGLYILNAMVPLYVASVGGSTTGSGVLNTCFTVCACAARISGGNLADRIGKRRVILLGGALLSVGLLAYLTVESFLLLMLFRGVQGLGFAAMSVGASAAVVDILPPSRLGEGIGISALAATLSGCIAPTVGVAVEERFGYGAVFGSTAAAVLVGLAVTVLFLHYEKNAKPAEKRKVPKEVRESFLWRIFERCAVLPAVLYCLFLIGSSMTYVFMTLYGVSRGFSWPGGFFLTAAAAQVFARVAAGRFADRGKGTGVVLFGCGVSVLTYLGLALFPNEGVYLLCGALFGLGQGLVSPVMNRLAVMHAAAERRGAATATYYLAADVGNGIGGMLWGVIIDGTSYGSSFLVVAVWIAVSAVLTGFCLRRMR